MVVEQVGLLGSVAGLVGPGDHVYHDNLVFYGTALTMVNFTLTLMEVEMIGFTQEIGLSGDGD